MKKRLLFVAIVMLLVFAMVACTPKEPELVGPTEEVSPDIVEPEPEIPEEPAVEVEEGIVSYEEIALTPMEAFDIYVELNPDKLVTKVELDKYFGSYVYKIEGYKDNEETEVKIDPINGDIISTNTETEMDSDRDREITIANIEKIQNLLDKSLLDAGVASMVDEWTLQWDDGILELEIDINLAGTGDIDYTYNIETGELIERD